MSVSCVACIQLALAQQNNEFACGCAYYHSLTCSYLCGLQIGTLRLKYILYIVFSHVRSLLLLSRTLYFYECSSQQLTGALLINPFDAESTREAMRAIINMTPADAKVSVLTCT